MRTAGMREFCQQVNVNNRNVRAASRHRCCLLKGNAVQKSAGQRELAWECQYKNTFTGWLAPILLLKSALR